eukprot:13684777-Ditylum_brightwellii.AAC.1
MDGRAEDRKKVYRHRVVGSLDHSTSPDDPISGQFFSEMVVPEWEEVTPSAIELEVLVDYAPNLR